MEYVPVRLVQVLQRQSGRQIRKKERMYSIIMKKAIVAFCMAGMLFGCTSCGNTNQSGTAQTTQAQVALTEIHDAVKEAYGEDYIPEMACDAELLETLFGIKGELYEEFIAEMPMMSAHTDQFVAIKAKEGKAEEVEQLLQTYQDNLLENSFQYPINQGKVEGATLYRNGNYVFYFILGGYPEDGSDVDSQKAKELNQTAIDAIEKLLGKAG